MASALDAFYDVLRRFTLGISDIMTWCVWETATTTICINSKLYKAQQVVPGQVGAGSFKIEKFIAYRAEQRLCL